MTFYKHGSSEEETGQQGRKCSRERKSGLTGGEIGTKHEWHYRGDSWQGVCRLLCLQTSSVQPEEPSEGQLGHIVRKVAVMKRTETFQGKECRGDKCEHQISSQRC